MKQVLFFFKFLILIALVSSSCTWDKHEAIKLDSAQFFSGNYFFTTIASGYGPNGTCDDTIYYQGKITKLSGHKIQIEFADQEALDSAVCKPSSGIIISECDDEGNLFNSEYYPDDPHCFFEGVINKKREIDLWYGCNFNGGGGSTHITGVRSYH